MTPIQIEFREVLMIVLALVGAYFFMVKTLTKQFKVGNDEQLASLKKSIEAIEGRATERYDQTINDVKRIDRDVLLLRGEMLNKCESREDAIRRELMMINRLEKINDKLDTRR